MTESGNLVEIPKYILNSRRIDDRHLTPQDFQNDYRMTAYDPIVAKNNYQTLNHKQQLDTGGKILIKPTHYESSIVVCYYGTGVQYCSILQPSGSFDFLSQGFDRVKLLITLVVLVVGVVISKPFVFNKKLNSEWID